MKPINQHQDFREMMRRKHERRPTATECLAIGVGFGLAATILAIGAYEFLGWLA